MLHHVVIGPPMEGNYAEEATQRIKNKGAEVGSQCDGQQRIRQGCQRVVRGIAKALEDAVWQCCDRRVSGRAGIAKHQGDSNYTDHSRDDGQCPDCLSG